MTEVPFIERVASEVLVADGGMGTMLQAAGLTLADFEDLEGCNEILNVTRPDVIADIHRAYFDVGVDSVQTNTFGTNWANLAEYGIEDRIKELALAGARIARDVADEYEAQDGRDRYVYGSIGPGTKLPSLGHTDFETLRDAYQQGSEGLLEGGVDLLLVETSQDLLQAKAAIIGSRLAMAEVGREVPIFAQVTIETTGTMLLGSEIGAALTALQDLGIAGIGMNCATGPAEMSEHLRYLSQHADLLLSCMPNAGLPELTADGARYPLTPIELADAHERFTKEYGLNFVGGCCGTTPEHLQAVVERVGHRPVAQRSPREPRSAASLYQSVPFRQDTTYLSIGERTNANGSKAFREAMLAGDWQTCQDIARQQTADGAHLLDLCVDYVGRDGVEDMRTLASLLATASTLPIVLDSTEPVVLEAGLECLGGRSVINSVNYEDGDGPDSRINRIMPLVKQHGAAVVALTIDEEGQARSKEWKVRVAQRLIEDLTGNYGMNTGDIIVDCLTFPIATGQEETRRDGIETIEAIREVKRLFPDVQTTLGVSNVSFGLSPAARQVLNSVFLHECVEAGLDSAIVHASKILPVSRIPEDQLDAAMALIYDRREYDEQGQVVFDPLAEFLKVFEGVTATSSQADRAAELAALPLGERLQRRIVDAERDGLTADLDEALQTQPALAIINDTLLAGMKTVGELFGAGEMQLPFVLASAETMKMAVAHLEPHMEKADSAGKGTIVLATVKGDVHDIGKNLVDIILSNNGYDVVNIGIKQPVNAIIEAAEDADADAIGMSGLLVKSTVVMKENLEELNTRGLAERWPVLLGGAALTRSFVEHDLGELFDGDVRYAKDAFEGLALMDTVMAIKRGDEGAVLPEPRKRRVRAKESAGDRQAIEIPARSDVSVTNPVPTPPFWGTRVVKGVAMADIVAYLDERATFVGQWGLKPRRGSKETFEQIAEEQARPRLRAWLDRIKTEGMLEPAVVYGYFPANSDGDDLIVYDPQDHDMELVRFSFPRQSRKPFLCLSDFFRPVASGEKDVVAFHVVTMGQVAADSTAALFESDSYRDYLELHGLSVQLTEALAELWHARVRDELGFSEQDDSDTEKLINKQGYRGSRYSFGYPACPDVEQQAELVQLLDPERIGVSLSPEFQLHPEQSTSAIIVHHPEAKYFKA
ncbi:MAG: methionine synthase [Actinobacteria bacterium]|nr:methionine synthase [Actinomycetota bacterium]